MRLSFSLVPPSWLKFASSKSLFMAMMCIKKMHLLTEDLQKTTTMITAREKIKKKPPKDSLTLLPCFYFVEVHHHLLPVKYFSIKCLYLFQTTELPYFLRCATENHFDCVRIPFTTLSVLEYSTLLTFNSHLLQSLNSNSTVLRCWYVCVLSIFDIFLYLTMTGSFVHFKID